MGLNDIRLSNSSVAALYPKSLVENDVTPPVKDNITVAAEPIIEIKSPAEKEWKHLGDNKKNILIAVNYPQFTHLPDDELNFLTAILSACQFTLGDVAIINHSNYSGIPYTEILKHYSSRTILLFGIEPTIFGLPVSFPEFQIQTFDGNKYLFGPGLHECRNDKLLKSKLWVCLRSIFGIQ